MLQEDMHGQVHMLREDWARRVRAIPTRLDTTDRKIVRQARRGLGGQRRGAAPIHCAHCLARFAAFAAWCRICRHEDASDLACGRFEVTWVKT
jgi:hypothetical protein